MTERETLDDIDAVGDIEDRMVEAARQLMDEHDYTLSEVCDTLDAALNPEGQ